MTFPFPFMPPTGPNVGPSSFWVGKYDSGSALSTYTFSSIPFGQASSSRSVLVAVAATSSTTVVVNSLTIGGISATEISSIASTAGVFLFMASVPSGISGDIVVTFSATAERCAVGVWISYEAGLTPIRAVSGSNAGVNLSLADIPVVSGKFLLSVALNGSASSSSSTAWTGVDSFTERFDGRLTTGWYTLSLGDVISTESNETRDLTTTFTNSTTNFGISCGFGTATGSPYTPVLADSVSSTSGLTTYTFTGRNIGTADSNRYVMVCLGWSNSTTRTVSSVTVGGQAATVVATGSQVAIYRIAYPTGTTADIVVTMSGACTAMSVGLFDTRCRASPYAFDSGANNATATTVTVANVGVNNGGFLIGVARMSTTATGSAVYNGIDTLSASQTTMGTASVVFLSALTTELKQTNDPGVSTVASIDKRVVFASFT